MGRRILKNFSIFACLLAFSGYFALSFSQPVAAQSNTNVNTCGQTRYFLGIPSWDRGLENCEELDGDDFLQGDYIKILANNILAIITHIAAFIAVGFIIYGGFQFVLSTGDTEKANRARQTIINAAIGSLIVIMARVVTEIIYNNLTG